MRKFILLAVCCLCSCTKVYRGVDTVTYRIGDDTIVQLEYPFESCVEPPLKQSHTTDSLEVIVERDMSIEFK